MDEKLYETVNASSYDKIAEKWHSFRKNCKINLCISEFADIIAKGGNILDVGCGTGHPVAEYFLERGFRITGIDPSAKMLEKAKDLECDRASFLHTDFLNFRTDKIFDAILAFDSLWYIPLEKQPLIYKKASSLLKNGGYFMFTHGKTQGETQGEMFNEPFLYAALSLDEVKDLLSENGFKIIKCETDYKEITTGTRDLIITAKKI